MNQFSGTGVALVTPFKRGKIDYESLEKIIRHAISGGVEFLVSLGTTGEAVTLSTRECKEVFRFTLDLAAGKVPVVAGLFGDNNTSRMLGRVSEYELEGFAAIMSSSPSYTKPTQEGIFQHYMKLAKASPLPIIIYNVPGRTASNVLPETTLRLAHASEKFIGVKEASGDLNQMQRILKHRPDGFLVLSGDDPLTLPLIGSGGDGVISVIANAFPRQFSDMVRAALAGDYPTARRLNNELLDIHPWLYVDGNPAGIKSALELLGLCKNDMRLPLVAMRESAYLNLKKEMEKVVKLPGA